MRLEIEIEENLIQRTIQALHVVLESATEYGRCTPTDVHLVYELRDRLEEATLVLNTEQTKGSTKKEISVYTDTDTDTDDKYAFLDHYRRVMPELSGKRQTQVNLAASLLVDPSKASYSPSVLNALITSLDMYITQPCAVPVGDAPTTYVVACKIREEIQALLVIATPKTRNTYPYGD